jgi:hypothetical protein
LAGWKDAIALCPLQISLLEHSQTTEAAVTIKAAPKRKEGESDAHYEGRIMLWMVEVLEPFSKRSQARILNFVADHFQEEKA